MPLIVIEGLDGSGKATNAAELCKRLEALGKKVRKITFPDYESDSSALVRMYLSGAFGDDPNSVGAYAASTFYAVDRYASFKTDWQKDYENGVWIIADRYTTSNAVHQASKLEGEQKDKYLDWLYEFEFGLMGLPAPDAVIYLDVPTDISQKLMSGRYGGDEGKKDIHEKDISYLTKTRAHALEVADRLGWHRVSLAPDGQLLSIECAADKVFDKIKEIYGDKL